MKKHYDDIFTDKTGRSVRSTLSLNELCQTWTCEANQAGENSSFIFTVCVKSVPRYNFKLDYVVLQMAVKEFFETEL